MNSLAAYYESLGYGAESWHVGPEHPRLEEAALALLEHMPRKRVLEIGYQAGGFAVPVITAMGARPEFAYTGVDSGAYRNAVSGPVIERYLREREIPGSYRFLTGDALAVLRTLRGQQFDLLLVDHYKPLYPREFRAILALGLASDSAYVLFHDVLGRAEREWEECKLLCEAFGFSWAIRADVPGGLAVARRDAAVRASTSAARRLRARVTIDAILGLRAVRAAVGRLVRRRGGAAGRAA